MTFEEILDQAIAMLQRRGRLTYGALKRQFQLDEDAPSTTLRPNCSTLTRRCVTMRDAASSGRLLLP